jgi:hypothetical protein
MLYSDIDPGASMFKNINEKINYTFELEIPARKNEIFFLLRNHAAEQNPFLFFLPGRLDFNEFRFLGDRIEIDRKPGTFTPFRAMGRIVITLREVSPYLTKVTFNVMPGSNTFPITATLLTIALVVWSAGWMVFSWRLDPLSRCAFPILIVAIVFTIQFLKYRSDRRALIDYAEQVIKVIRDGMSSTRAKTQ